MSEPGAQSRSDNFESPKARKARKPSALDDPARHPSDEYFDKTFKAAVDEKDGKMREFDTGATRDSEDGKLDYDGFLSPCALKRYAEYMHSHRQQSDGKMRDSDNWQKGIPLACYMKSLWRHVVEMWTMHRSGKYSIDLMQSIVCAVIFNAFGYLHEITKGEGGVSAEEPEPFGVGSCLPKDTPAKEEEPMALCAKCKFYEGCGLTQRGHAASFAAPCISFAGKSDGTDNTWVQKTPPVKEGEPYVKPLCSCCSFIYTCSLPHRGAECLSCQAFVEKS